MTTAPQRNQAPSPDATSADHWQIELLYDGDCPLCVREVNFLRKKDAGRGLVQFVDIADDTYNPTQHGGVDFETAMGRIHALRAMISAARTSSMPYTSTANKE